MAGDNEIMTTKRGGASGSPLHIARAIAVTLLLILAAVAFILNYHLVAWILMIIGGTLALLHR